MRIPTPLSLLQHLAHKTWLGFHGLAAAMALGLAIVIAACSGGGADVGSGGTGAFSVSAYSEGTITGFGSVFVNGLRYDDTSASVSDEDGPRSRSDLKLGMVVAVNGNVDSNDLASASGIRYDSALLGPVALVNAGAKTFTIIGQTVNIDASTVFDASLAQGFNSVQKDQLLEVHGFLNAATNTVQATLVERKSSTSKYKIGGLVKNLQTSARTLQIGTETLSYGDINLGAVKDGSFIKLRLEPRIPNGTSSWTITGYNTDSRSTQSQERAEVEGLVTQINSPTQFVVANMVVNTANASFPNGAATVAVGNRVQAKGKLVNGVLEAKEVKAESKGSKDIELRGAISNVDTTAKTFVLRGLTVSFADPVDYDKGTQSNLVNGAQVEVKGQSSTSSATLRATRIKFSN
jgi:Domain of unknown function (DUF5666)